jgi:hypothetical protein
MYAKGLEKMLFASSTKYLKFGRDGRFVVIFVSLVSRSIPVFISKILFLSSTNHKTSNSQTARTHIIILILQAERGFAAGAVLFDLGGNGAFWQKKGVTLRGLRISEKKEILHKLTVFNDGGNSNCRLSLSRRLAIASIRGPSLLIIEL